MLKNWTVLLKKQKWQTRDECEDDVATDECEDDGIEERSADDYLLLDSRSEEDIELDVRNENHGWLFGTPLCPLPCYDLVIEDSLQEFHASLQSLKPEERLRSIKNRISILKVNSDIPPIGYRNILLLSLLKPLVLLKL